MSDFQGCKMRPVDGSKITRPETSKDYRSFCKAARRKSFEALRQDGRSPDDHRPMFLQTGIVSQSGGSAYVEHGNTKVICAVYGPKEIPRRSDFSMKGVLMCKLQHAPFSDPRRRNKRFNRSGGGSNDDYEEKELSVALKEALEATVCLHVYPKSQVDVFVMILENDGSALAAALTCSSLALANASIQMFDVLIGGSIKRIGGRRYTDPTLEEEKLATDHEPTSPNSCLTVGYQPSSEQSACLLHEGCVDRKVLSSDIEYVTRLCASMLPNVQKCLIESVQSGADKSSPRKT